MHCILMTLNSMKLCSKNQFFLGVVAPCVLRKVHTKTKDYVKC